MKTTPTVAFLLGFLAAAPEAHAQARQVKVADGETLRVVESGRGEPIVIVPGLLGSAFGFRKLTASLADRGYRVMVVEPLGFGGSTRPPEADYSLTAQADRIAAALDVMEVRDAVVVAHAVGASMALRLAWRHPDHVRAIVSLDGGPAEAAATPGVRRAMRFAFLVEIFGDPRGLRGAVRSTLRERSADPGWVTEDVVDGYMASGLQDVDGTVGALRQMARAPERERLAPRLRHLRCPVHLLVGDAAAARGISDTEIRLLRDELTALSMETVVNAGHFLFEEHPGVVAAAVERVRPPQRSAEQIASGGR